MNPDKPAAEDIPDDTLRLAAEAAGFLTKKLYRGSRIRAEKLKPDREKLEMPEPTDQSGKMKDTIPMPTVEMLGETCTMEIQCYQNGRTAIQLWSESGPMAKATVNLPEMPVPKNHIIIKNCDENEGMAENLEKAGLGKIVEGDTLDDYVLMEATHPAVLEQIAAVDARYKAAKQKKEAEGPEM